MKDSALDNLTLEDVVEAVNSRNTSGLFMTEKNFLRGLGEKVYNSSGALIGAREATLTWVGRYVQREEASKVRLCLQGEPDCPGTVRISSERRDCGQVGHGI